MVWLLLVLIAPTARSQQSEELSAQQVLDRMFSVYESCSSYIDRGKVKEVFLRLSGNQLVTKPFTTAFVRPSRFRFEYTEGGGSRTHNLVVWRDGSSIRSWWSINRETRHYETLAEPLRNATGVSSQSAAIVPTMLFRNLGDRRRLQNLTDLELVRVERTSGKAAYRIQGKDWMNQSLTLWIDKETFLLIRLYEKRKADGYDVETTIRYEPQINVDVPAKKLEFKH